MARPRDSQRSKVYKAEGNIAQGEMKAQMVDLQAFVNKVVGSAWWKRHYPNVQRITATDGRRRRRASAFPLTRKIVMPKWSRSEMIILHEIAHIVTPTQYAWHGPEYCKVYLELVKVFMGEETWKSLRDSFKVCRVKWIVRECRNSVGPKKSLPPQLKQYLAAKAAAKQQLMEAFESNG